MKENKRTYFMCEMKDGNRVDFAEVCRDMLMNPTRSQNVAPKKLRTQKEVSDKSISKKHYEVRAKGEARFEGMKLSVCGFDTKTKGSGTRSMDNFRFERALKEKFAYCRFRCSCGG